MRGWFETVAALILGLATLGSAWSAYQSSLWGGIQNFRIADALAVGRRAGEKAIDANELRKVDAVLFDGWERHEDWGDVSFMMEQGQQIEKMAIVADEKWRDDAFAFTA